jgi:hypothetical protein
MLGAEKMMGRSDMEEWPINEHEVFEIFGSPLCLARGSGGTQYFYSADHLADPTALVTGAFVKMKGTVTMEKTPKLWPIEVEAVPAPARDDR